MIKIEQQENIDAITQSIFLIVTHPEKDVDSFLCIVKIILNFKITKFLLVDSGLWSCKDGRRGDDWIRSHTLVQGTRDHA